MSRHRVALVLIALTLGAGGVAAPALADVLPGLPGIPTAPPAPVAPPAPGQPIPAPPAVPGVPTAPGLPAVPAPPVNPAVPALPKLPPLTAPKAGASLPAAGPGAFGVLAFGHFVDDGPRVAVEHRNPPTPHFALPKPLPYDVTGLDTRDFVLPRASRLVARQAAAAEQAGGRHRTAILAGLLALAAVGGGIVLARRRHAPVGA